MSILSAAECGEFPDVMGMIMENEREVKERREFLNKARETMEEIKRITVEGWKKWCAMKAGWEKEGEQLTRGEAEMEEKKDEECKVEEQTGGELRKVEEREGGKERELSLVVYALKAQWKKEGKELTRERKREPLQRVRTRRAEIERKRELLQKAYALKADCEKEGKQMTRERELLQKVRARKAEMERKRDEDLKEVGHDEGGDRQVPAMKTDTFIDQDLDDYDADSKASSVSAIKM
ncbi:hypothetical protein AB205_0221570 [Aquarana catesbeiana]|uniref:Uncharacterized protein n=1 Tax=Aquarana catesbeiana TaxID=8400 RepID=A0A2G9Q3G3_AQUCT|nr:hypothetical protein AB205_0221570 [Aquarana catesbeiana]